MEKQREVSSHDFYDFLPAKFCHLSVDKILGNNSGNGRNDPDDRGIQNIFPCSIPGKREVGNTAYRYDEHTCAIEYEPKCDHEKGEDDHFSKPFPLVCIYIHNYSD